VQNWNQSYWGCDFSSYSLCILWDGTLAIMSYASSITSPSVGLLLVHHEPCHTFRDPVQRSELLPLFHLQQHLWMVCPFFPSVMCRPHSGHSKTLLSNPASWRNSSAVSSSSMRHTKNILAATLFRPTDCDQMTLLRTSQSLSSPPGLLHNSFKPWCHIKLVQ
jgi:hypothetical protein